VAQIDVFVEEITKFDLANGPKQSPKMHITEGLQFSTWLNNKPFVCIFKNFNNFLPIQLESGLI
jgi:hypothetical protein